MQGIALMRKRAGLTQEALADMIGVCRETVARWENGTRNPSMLMMIQLAAALGCKIDDLVAEDEEHEDGE